MWASPPPGRMTPRRAWSCSDFSSAAFGLQLERSDSGDLGSPSVLPSRDERAALRARADASDRAAVWLRGGEVQVDLSAMFRKTCGAGRRDVCAPRSSRRRPARSGPRHDADRRAACASGRTFAPASRRADRCRLACTATAGFRRAAVAETVGDGFRRCDLLRQHHLLRVQLRGLSVQRCESRLCGAEAHVRARGDRAAHSVRKTASKRACCWRTSPLCSGRAPGLGRCSRRDDHEDGRRRDACELRRGCSPPALHGAGPSHRTKWYSCRPFVRSDFSGDCDQLIAGFRLIFVAPLKVASIRWPS